MKVLNVAEKPSISKAISGILASGGRYDVRPSRNKYVKNYQFINKYEGRDCEMVVTAVLGHLLELDFAPEYRKWHSCPMIELFAIGLVQSVKADMEAVADNIKREARTANVLVIWTDCDLEGEAIGAEIADTARQANPRITIKRARFSVLQPREVNQAWFGLQNLNYRQVAAVEARSELDLRIGAAFTRLQTLRLKSRFSEFRDAKVISYGSCQFPTLGFIVERYLQIQQFLVEEFWYLDVQYCPSESTSSETPGPAASFKWSRGHLFDFHSSLVLYESCMEDPTAHVVSVNGRPTSKWAPLPLTTVEMMKTGSRILHLPSDVLMQIAENLYNQGIISYPRTETDIFDDAYDLQSLVRAQLMESRWANYAQQLLDGKFTRPRKGSHDDKAHPPIHPVRAAPNLTGDERRVYEFVARRFLACCSEAAKGHQTTVTIRIAHETFSASGLMILERNYLDIYTYDSWKGNKLPVFTVGATFTPSSFMLKSGKTTAPTLLTEADLIAIMDKNGIGTDATIHEHIKKIQERDYTRKNASQQFYPTELGLALVTGYDQMEFELSLSKPDLRRLMELNMRRICDGSRAKEDVVREAVQMYRDAFVIAERQSSVLEDACAHYLGHAPDMVEAGGGGDPGLPLPQDIRKCHKCRTHQIALKKTPNSTLIGCRGYPNCKESIFLPAFAQNVSVSANAACPTCARPGEPHVKMLDFVFERGQVPPSYPLIYTTCVYCDQGLLELIDAGRSFRTNSSSTLAAPRPTPARNTQIAPTQPPPPIAPPTSKRSNSNSERHPTVAAPSSEATCHCRLPAALRTSKSENNFNRSFHACSKHQSDSTRCTYFQWLDKDSSAPPSFSATARSSSFSSSSFQARASKSSFAADASEIRCQCNIQAKSARSAKENENKNRLFFVCAKNQCKFFQWDEDGGSGGGTSGTAPSGSLACFRCGQIGHFASNCPNS